MADEPKSVSNLTARLLTAGVAAPAILSLLFYAPKWGFAALVFAVVVVASLELGRMVVSSPSVARGWFAIGACGVTAALVYAPTVRVLASLVVGLVLGGLLVALSSVEPIERAASKAGWLIAGPLYVGAPLASLAALHARPEGGSWVVLTMMLAWFADTGGYFAGRAFGRHKLFPSVSPKKTVEGLVGALLGSLGGALWAHFGYLPSLPLGHAAALGLVGGALGQAGDLAESLIKRGCGVKDSGAILPGHGGILDRIDALMFTGSATWLYAEWFAK